MKLCAYLIDGYTINELDTHFIDDLDGYSSFIVSETVPDRYQDISSIETWHLYLHYPPARYTAQM